MYCLLSVLWLAAQDIPVDSTNLEADTIIIPQKPLLNFKCGIFGEFQVEQTPIFDEWRPMTGFGIGVQYKSLLGGFKVHQFQGTVTSLLIFPNTFSLEYRYGAGYLGFQLLNIKIIELDLRCNYGRGDLVWQKESNDENFLRDEFSIFIPEIMVLYTPIEAIKLYCQVGYKQMSDLELAKLSNKNLSGFTFGIGLRCGIYQKQ